MMAASRGIILSGLTAIHRTVLGSNVFPGVPSQVRQYAARKGTREKARKKKVKKEVKKLTLADKIQRAKKTVIVKPSALIYTDNHRPEPVDDVYFMKYFKYKKYPFEEAIKCHREYLHPTIMNAPNATVELFAELNFEGVKKTKPVETFRKIVSMSHKFDHGEERQVLVFCKNEDQVKDALDEGAALAGGTDIIKTILKGDISLSGYDVVLAHPNMMADILTIRGLLKKKHPSIKAGTLSPDIKTMVRTQLHGIKYTAKAFERFPTYAEASIPIGKLDMDIKHLEDNMKDAINSLMSAKPKRPGSFITRLQLLCPPSTEHIMIDHTLYVKDETPVSTEKQVEEIEEEDDDAAVAIPSV